MRSRLSDRRPARAIVAAVLATLGMLTLGTAGLAAEAPMTRVDPRLMERTFIDMGHGRRIHAACLGSGSPTVLFEPGGEGSMLSWGRVEGAITAMTRTCFYDRAGMGYSDPSDKPISALNVTDEMAAVLARLKVRGPVVIVGHSIGGFYGTVFADRFPDKVAGLVLIDPGFAHQLDPRPPESLEVDRQHIRAGEAHLLVCADLARAGKLAPNDNGCMGYPPPLSQAETDYLTYIVTHSFWYEAEHDQSQRYFVSDDAGPSQDTREAWSVRRDWGALPVIVLSASNPPTRTYNTPAMQAAQAEDWQAGHRALAARSKAGQWRLIPQSTHFVQLTQPQAVIDAVAEVLASVRSPRSSSRP